MISTRPEDLKRILRARLAGLGINPNALAKRVGLDHTVLSRTLDGRIPSYATLLKVCEALYLQISFTEIEDAPLPAPPPTPPPESNEPRTGPTAAEVCDIYFSEDASIDTISAHLVALDPEDHGEMFRIMAERGADEDERLEVEHHIRSLRDPQ